MAVKINKTVEVNITLDEDDAVELLGTLRNSAGNYTLYSDLYDALDRAGVNVHP
jgi:hypothetical protein